VKELIWPTMERIEQLQSGAGALTGVPSGFVDLDRYTAGFQRSDLVILAARPSMGKTALALNIVQHAAIEHNTPIAVFSLEMSKDSSCNGCSARKAWSTRNACGAANCATTITPSSRAPRASSARRPS